VGKASDFYPVDGGKIQGVTERFGQTLGTSSTYQNKKKYDRINMCPETFNLLFIAER
jgi:hypothetical protein